MTRRKAVVILGVQNSGKTTTIKRFDNNYHKPKSNCKKGWRLYERLFLPVLEHLCLHLYIVPYSPTERGQSLKDLLEGNLPEFLLIAEQHLGSRYGETIDFLTLNDYDVSEFLIQRTIKNSDNWTAWDKSSKDLKLNNRAIEIKNAFLNFIRRRV
jgi:hypothetical protein